MSLDISQVSEAQLSDIRANQAFPWNRKTGDESEGPRPRNEPEDIGDIEDYDPRHIEELTDSSNRRICALKNDRFENTKFFPWRGGSSRVLPTDECESVLNLGDICAPCSRRLLLQDKDCAWRVFKWFEGCIEERNGVVLEYLIVPPQKSTCPFAWYWDRPDHHPRDVDSKRMCKEIRGAFKPERPVCLPCWVNTALDEQRHAIEVRIGDLRRNPEGPRLPLDAVDLNRDPDIKDMMKALANRAFERYAETAVYICPNWNDNYVEEPWYIPCKEDRRKAEPPVYCLFETHADRTLCANCMEVAKDNTSTLSIFKDWFTGYFDDAFGRLYPTPRERRHGIDQ